MYGELTEATLRLQPILDQAQGVGMRIQTMGNESINSCKKYYCFNDGSTNFIATHLLFIDADIGFQWKNIERLLCMTRCSLWYLPKKAYLLRKIKGVRCKSKCTT